MRPVRTMVLGLGNPGTRYRATRHNIGFRVVDSIVAERGLCWRRCGWFRPLAWVAEDDSVILVKPRTYMNRSGLAASTLCERHRITPHRVVAVYDDADLELGLLRLRKSGGPGGHNGVRSLTAALKTPEYPRVRLGVKGTGRSGTDLAQYLLSPFDVDELQCVDDLVASAAQAVKTILDEDVESAMNRFNNRGFAAQGDG